MIPTYWNSDVSSVMKCDCLQLFWQLIGSWSELTRELFLHCRYYTTVHIFQEYFQNANILKILFLICSFLLIGNFMTIYNCPFSIKVSIWKYYYSCILLRNREFWQSFLVIALPICHRGKMTDQDQRTRWSVH